MTTPDKSKKALIGLPLYPNPAQGMPEEIRGRILKACRKKQIDPETCDAILAEVWNNITLHPAHAMREEFRKLILEKCESMQIEPERAEAFLVEVCNARTRYAAPLRDSAENSIHRDEVQHSLQILEHALATAKTSGAVRWLHYAQSKAGTGNDLPGAPRAVHLLEQITKDALQILEESPARKRGRVEARGKAWIVSDVAAIWERTTGREVTLSEGTGFDYVMHVVWSWLREVWKVQSPAPITFRADIKKHRDAR
ncbi:MAG: hypothetical protein WD708_01675 [Kiritimatiellia bacterium]